MKSNLSDNCILTWTADLKYIIADLYWSNVWNLYGPRCSAVVVYLCCDPILRIYARVPCDDDNNHADTNNKRAIDWSCRAVWFFGCKSRFLLKSVMGRAQWMRVCGIRMAWCIGVNIYETWPRCSWLLKNFWRGFLEVKIPICRGSKFHQWNEYSSVH